MECVLPTKKYGDLTFYIDAEDEYILDGKIYVSRVKSNHQYYFYLMNDKRQYIHRVIMNAPKGMVVDHINHNTLDNRKSNLRVVTNSENLRNSYNAATDSQKLSQKQVEEILLSDESNKKLAAKFNVSNALISYVRTGICYANYCPNIVRVKNKWFTKQSSLVNKYMGYKQCKNA